MGSAEPGWLRERVLVLEGGVTTAVPDGDPTRDNIAVALQLLDADLPRDSVAQTLLEPHALDPAEPDAPCVGDAQGEGSCETDAVPPRPDEDGVKEGIVWPGDGVTEADSDGEPDAVPAADALEDPNGEPDAVPTADVLRDPDGEPDAVPMADALRDPNGEPDAVPTAEALDDPNGDMLRRNDTDAHALEVEHGLGNGDDDCDTVVAQLEDPQAVTVTSALIDAGALASADALGIPLSDAHGVAEELAAAEPLVDAAAVAESVDMGMPELEVDADPLLLNLRVNEAA